MIKLLFLSIPLSGTALKKSLNTCVKNICATAVIPIICKANLFLVKLGIILSKLNSLQLNALNNALNANIPNMTVSPFASGTFNMFVEDCNISINVIYKALPIIVKIIDLVIIFSSFSDENILKEFSIMLKT